MHPKEPNTDYTIYLVDHSSFGHLRRFSCVFCFQPDSTLIFPFAPSNKKNDYLAAPLQSLICPFHDRYIEQLKYFSAKIIQS